MGWSLLRNLGLQIRIRLKPEIVEHVESVSALSRVIEIEPEVC